MRLLVLIVGVLAALSLPGVRAARAQSDVVPPAAELFSWKSDPHPSEQGPVSCAATSEATAGLAEARRQAALAQLAELLKGSPDDPAQPLDGRGYGYHAPRDPYRELRMVEMEAQRQRALRAAGQH